MKKLLFGLLALSLSAATFAANPGTATDASINVEAKLTVIDAAGKVVVEELTDAGTWKVVSSAVAFDHGTVTKGSTEVPTPSILKNFRVRKLDGNGDDELTANSTVNVLMSGDTTTPTGLVAGNLRSATNNIVHNFRYTPSATIGSDSTAKFNIESNVPALVGTEPVGAYNRVETVTVNVTL